MNKKLLVVFMVMLITCYCCCGCSSDKNIMTSEERIEQIFDISGVGYEVVAEENALSEKVYGGSYSVVLKVEKEYASEFIAKLEEGYYIPENVEEYENVIKNIYGKKLGETDMFYIRLAGPQREIEGKKSHPKTCGFYIICSKEITGEYEIKMKYDE